MDGVEVGRPLPTDTLVGLDVRLWQQQKQSGTQPPAQASGELVPGAETCVEVKGTVGRSQRSSNAKSARMASTKRQASTRTHLVRRIVRADVTGPHDSTRRLEMKCVTCRRDGAIEEPPPRGGGS